MSIFYDDRDARDHDARERELFAQLPAVLASALAAPAYAEHLGKIDPKAITSREALAKLPILRKSDLPAMQKKSLPFGDLIAAGPLRFGRLFTSPGPIFEAEGRESDPWRSARGLYAMGLRPGDIVLNTLSYHMTPGGFIMDAGARSLGCPVIPAGPGNTDGQLDLIEAYHPNAYAGTPDFLKILLDAAAEKGRNVSCIKKAAVSGAAFPKSLQAEFASRGIVAHQAYATADIGFIAYETGRHDGLVVNEGIILEIVRPGTGDPVAPGEVGEIVVTTLDPHHPKIRLALGDLTATMDEPSPCGRTNMRIKGWMGRADQTTKIKGMFVRPEQIATVLARHPEIVKARLVVTRDGETDAMALHCETAQSNHTLADAIVATLQAATKLRGRIVFAAPGSLANDGKVIADERKYD